MAGWYGTGMIVVVWVSRVVVACVFLLAAYGKLTDPLKFAEQIRGYQLVPDLWSNAMAYALPPVELAAAVLLLVGLWRFEARLLIIGMLIVFTLAKLSVEARGMKIDCGCISGFSKIMSGPWGILFNVALLSLLAFDWKASRNPSRTTNRK